MNKKLIMDSGFGNFLILWMGEFISSIGSGLTAFGLGVYVFQQTGTASSVALITLAAFLPGVLLSPFSGVLSDRFDRRLLMLIGDGMSALGLIYILFSFSTGAFSLWTISLGLGFNSIFTSLLEPAYRSSITDLLDEKEYARAGGMVQLAGSAKFLLAPLIAGFLISVTSIETIIWIDISTFIVTVGTILFVRKKIGGSKLPKTSKQSFLKDFMDGWQAINKNKGVLWVIGIISLVTFSIGFLQTLFTPYLLAMTSPHILGIVQTVAAFGMLVASLFIGVLNSLKKYRKTLGLALGLSGVFIGLMGLTSNIFLITIAGFFFFAMLPFINTSAEVLIRKNIDNKYQGRAWGLIGILSQIGFVVAYGISGILADYVFKPILVEGGWGVNSLGIVFGVGESRGIGLLLFLAGFFIILISCVFARIKSIKTLEKGLE